MQVPIPKDGWRFDGSFSYGAADAYNDIPHVVVNVFPEADRAVATEAHRFLKENGVTTATMDEARHADDGLIYIYVFAERDEFLACRERLFPDVPIAPRLPHK